MIDQTISFMWHRTRELYTENLQLKMDAESIAADERAKIVGYIRQVADRIENDPDGMAWGHLQAMAIVIEAGEHLI